MRYPRNKKNIIKSKELRKNMTKEERHLWYDYLNKHSIHFYRQRIIGNYIVDFFAQEEKLIIELDGSQHYEEKGLEYDKKRTEYFESLGIHVLRFSNLDVLKNFEGVCKEIERQLFHHSVSYAASSPQGEPLKTCEV